MWARAYQIGSWIGAALAALVSIFALFWFVTAGMGLARGESNAAGRTAGLASVILSLALLLATPLAVRRSGRLMAGLAVAAIVVFSTFFIGLALIAVNAY